MTNVEIKLSVVVNVISVNIILIIRNVIPVFFQYNIFFILVLVN